MLAIPSSKCNSIKYINKYIYIFLKAVAMLRTRVGWLWHYADPMLAQNHPVQPNLQAKSPNADRSNHH